MARTKRRTMYGQKIAEQDARTDTDRTIYLSCPVRSQSEVLRRLDQVAFETENAWGNLERLLAVQEPEWRVKFEAQLARLNDAIDADDAETIIKAAHGMERAWRKLDALARERGHRPPGETVWLRQHPHHGKCVIYSSDASIADLPQDVPHFHIDEVVKFIPAALFDVKKNFPDSTVAEVRDLNDEIPF
jgi:hypothetical protein